MTTDLTEIEKWVADHGGYTITASGPCIDCHDSPATQRHLPDRYYPHYSPDSFSLSEIVERCDRCSDRWHKRIERRKAAGCKDAGIPSPYSWL